MLFVGLDVHAKSVTGCILDGRTGQGKQVTWRGGVAEMLVDLQRMKARMQVCYEASCGYGDLFDRLMALPNVKRIAVAHPGHLRLIFRSKQKNDRVDAGKLALLLRLNEVPEVHVPSVDVRAWRAAIEFRGKLVAKQTMVKNQIRAVLRTHGMTGGHRKQLWTRNGLAWLAELQLPTGLARLQMGMLLEELAAARARVLKITRELDRMAARHAGVHLLQTVPGVGPRTAEAMVAYVDVAERFKRNKQIGSYLGLVPQQDQSGGTNRLGHITREGPATVRKLLTEAAWQGVQRSPEIRAHYERIKRGDPQRGKIALIATTHWLARVMLAMLKSGEEARFTKQTRREEQAGQQTAA